MSRGDYRPFRVSVVAHHVPPRWDIPAGVRTVFERDEQQARTHGIRSAHRDVGVPPLRSLMRVSWPYVSAVPEAGDQLPL